VGLKIGIKSMETNHLMVPKAQVRMYNWSKLKGKHARKSREEQIWSKTKRPTKVASGVSLI